MNEEISKEIAEVDAAIYGAELSMSYYRGRVEAFEEARKLLAQSEMSGYLKDAEGKRIRKEQEQQEVDLEKEYQEFCKDYPFPWSSQYVNREYLDELCLSIARHFYELGRNARKEEGL